MGEDEELSALLARRLTLTRSQEALRADHAAMVAASEGSNADDEHDPEGATIAFERSQVAALLRQVTQELAEIDAAVERSRTGGYGVCERCGSPIGAERLAARPATRRCIRCATIT